MSAAAVNRDVRVEAGTDGTVVVMSAYCAKCAQAVMPRDDGTCSWCGTVIVDEDTLPAGAMIAQLADRKNRHTPEPDEPSSVEAAAPEKKRRADHYWTSERIIAAIQAWAVKHGRPPTSTEWARSSGPDREHPPFSTVAKQCGSWSAAIRAAGFEPLGPRGRRGSGLGPKAAAEGPAPLVAASEPPALPSREEPPRPEPESDPAPPKPEPQTEADPKDTDGTVTAEILQLLDLLDGVDTDRLYIWATTPNGDDPEEPDGAVALFRRLLRAELDRYSVEDIGDAVLARIDARTAA